VAGALSYTFCVPGESHARELASALAEFGFPQVSGRPNRYGVWEVRVIDDGREYDELHADRQREAVMQQAMAVAMQHRGNQAGLPESYPPGKTPSLAQSGAQILLLNPGRHPPVPAIKSVVAPPPGLLSLEPDLPALTAPDFAEMWSIPWDVLDHGPMMEESLPGLISDLVLGEREWYEFYDELVPAIVREGTLHAASGPALTVLGRLAASGSLEAAKRRDVYMWLFLSAGQLREDLIDDIADGRQPLPHQWCPQVREAVQAITPELLARWDVEPPACQLALAVLAAEFPEHGAAVVDKITQAAGEHRGTQPGEYLMLARHLISGDATAALASATAIACWNEDVLRGWMVYCDVFAPGLRAMQILSEAVPAAVLNG
jgi:hypothetical protein